ncbi:CCA tRNA nucleotidyltransferase [Staphylococcus cohnii]|uniref:CCA-adding enzyme n=1 Tax=Staphylococcus cohnii TaxID=29382 RepID=A0ABT6IW75_9STAP|nr:CCA tRNA nucleotidyltransferase [Staphylococcus cohnii]MCI2941112.1 CCA tRNA nucleotidyltransferase [Staphylococcus cohnii]MDE1708838.1 CCA tRNA nucleotidyltransferase [Staphylococcus cohnii]MDH5138691.1 CCA tRNA nucleotidyltransferase [Staphylococcus cohnii]MDH5156758.1 CCA tRNA nucleotidyltransferase [Staphylococcus cohnii]MDH5168497.1 CCA tRNA nucleotidyltransferase [Staphylococcus cohnii]
MTKTLFEQAKPILKTLQSNQYQAYFVGGSVRDYLMHKTIHDIDITTSATPEEVEAIFEKTIPIGREHGTINVVYNGEHYEVTTFRAEGDYDDHRRPNEVFFVRELYEDVKRRDFTMNAIAMDADFHIHDYFNGQQDIKNRIIRTVGNAQERFNEDALRIIRGLRFQSQLGFSLENETFYGMQSHINDIEHLSIERIVVELKKLTSGKYVANSFENLQRLNAFNYIPFFKHYNLNNFILDEAIPFTLLVALLKVQQPSIKGNLNDLKISNNDKKYISKLEKLLNQLPNIKSKSDFKILIYDYGEQDIQSILNYMDLHIKNHLPSFSPLIINTQSVKEVSKQLPIQSRKDIDINGKVILEAVNKQSGPWLKTILRDIELAIIDGDVQNIKSELIRWVKSHVEIQ